MAYQYKREPLTQDEATELANACESTDERLVIWTLLDTGLRVGELAALTRKNVDWQGHRLMVYGKGGPYGKKSKRRVVPLSNRTRSLIEHHFSLNETFGRAKRSLQYTVKRIANRAHISRPCSAHVLRHTFAVTALKKGINLRALQMALGHDRIETTMIYLNLSGQDVVDEFAEKW